MRSNVLVITGLLAVLSNSSSAQQDSVTEEKSGGRARAELIVPITLGLSVALDEEAREAALHNHTRSLDHLAKAVNQLGVARNLIPAMALTYAGAALTGHDSLARGTLLTAAGYAAADMVESVLKPVIGRERPHVEGNSRRFRPFTNSGDWHSFPSAHVSHIAAIAEGLSEQTHSDAISAVGDALVYAVAWDRIYEDQHWLSDVVTTATISTLVSGTTVKWLEKRLSRRGQRHQN
jgi:PAP2 superfamily